VPWEQLLEAQTQVTGGFTPVLDGKYLPHHFFDPAAPAESRDVPVIISTTLEDAALRLTNWDLTESGRAHPAMAEIRCGLVRHDGLRREHARRQRSARGNASLLRPESRSGNGGSGRLRERVRARLEVYR
jgi:hypothetical protein